MQQKIAFYLPGLIISLQWSGGVSRSARASLQPGTAHFPEGHQSLSLTDDPIVAELPALLCNLCSEGSELLLWPLFPAVKAP